MQTIQIQIKISENNSTEGIALAEWCKVVETLNAISFHQELKKIAYHSFGAGFKNLKDKFIRI